MNNDELIGKLLAAKREKTKITYRHKDSLSWQELEQDHAWNLELNEYEITARREYIVRVRNAAPVIEHPYNNWTRSDFGHSGQDEFILMREVYQDEM